MSKNDELEKRDTIRDANAPVGSGNTLRGLNNGAPGADDAPPSSGMGVVVPGVREPGPVEAVALEKKSSVPRLLQQGVTVPPEWLPKAKVEFHEGDDEQRTDYSPPEAAPSRTDHKTFELQTVKVDPWADPRTAPTQRKLKAPPAAGPDSMPMSSTTSTTVAPQLVLWVPIILAVLAFATIVIAAIAFRGRGEETPVEPVVAPPATATFVPVPAETTPKAVPETTVAPVETTSSAPAPSASAPTPKKPGTASARPSTDPFGRAF